MKMNIQILFISLALCAGMMIPFQSAMNAQLGKTLQSPYFSALTVFVVAMISLALYVLVFRHPVPSVQNFRSAPPWSYLGGILGAAYILLIVICAPKLGIGNVTVMVLAGQLVAAMVIDHWGLLNTPVHPINWPRVAGILLMAAGVYLVKKF
jgi:bacterial/archaeal transporter family-2 protein